MTLSRKELQVIILAVKRRPYNEIDLSLDEKYDLLKRLQAK